MSLLKRLLGKKKEESPYHLTLHLNARLMPLDRGMWYEDPIDALLAKAGIGEIDGGGTLMDATREITSCDVDISLKKKSGALYDQLLRVLERFEMPKGSCLISEEGSSEESRREIGNMEGLAFYLNGVELAEETYKTCDVDFVISELNRLLGNEGKYYSYWRGPTETALYVYGSSFEKMKGLIMPFREEYPLCEKSRIVQIA